jgi:hypothetical protein
LGMCNFKAGESNDWLCYQGWRIVNDVHPGDTKFYGKAKNPKLELPQASALCDF